MSDLTKRLRERIISESVRDFDTGELKMREAQDPLAVEAADRIEALEECLRGIMVEWDGYGIADSSLTRAIDKARDLLERK